MGGRAEDLTLAAESRADVSDTAAPSTEKTGALSPSPPEEVLQIPAGSTSGSGLRTSDPPTDPDQENLSLTDPSRYSPFASRAPVTTSTLAAKSSNSGEQSSNAGEQSSNTTMQSMQRPEVAAGGVSQTRRFLSIERDLEQQSATTRLLQKQIEATRREARIALGLGVLALLAAVALYAL